MVPRELATVDIAAAAARLFKAPPEQGVERFATRRGKVALGLFNSLSIGSGWFASPQTLIEAQRADSGRLEVGVHPLAASPPDSCQRNMCFHLEFSTKGHLTAGTADGTEEDFELRPMYSILQQALVALEYGTPEHDGRNMAVIAALRKIILPDRHHLVIPSASYIRGVLGIGRRTY